jgi:hypothetical protein
MISRPRHDAFDFVGIASVVGDVRMEVAVARMEDVGEPQAMGVADRPHAFEHFGETRPGTTAS